MEVMKIFATFGFSGVKQSISILTTKTVWKAHTKRAISTDTEGTITTDQFFNMN